MARKLTDAALSSCKSKLKQIHQEDPCGCLPSSFTAASAQREAIPRVGALPLWSVADIQAAIGCPNTNATAMNKPIENNSLKLHPEKSGRIDTMPNIPSAGMRYSCLAALEILSLYMPDAPIKVAASCLSPVPCSSCSARVFFTIMSSSVEKSLMRC